MTKQEFLSTYTHYKIVEQYKNEFGGGIHDYEESNVFDNE